MISGKPLTRNATHKLLAEVHACTLCADYLPLSPRPVLEADPSARILIAGQAPGSTVHASGIPFDDASGDRLRSWMGIDKPTFYDATRIAILPMGFCFPGTGKSGDLPPRPECAVTWRARLLAAMPAIELTSYRERTEWYFPEENGLRRKTSRARIEFRQPGSNQSFSLQPSADSTRAACTPSADNQHTASITFVSASRADEIRPRRLARTMKPTVPGPFNPLAPLVLR